MAPHRASLAPDQPAGTVHMVLDDFGPKLGRAWREMDAEKTDERDIVHGIIAGEYRRPVQVVAFNLEERWVRDVTEDIAQAVIDTASENGSTLSREAVEFVERVTGRDVCLLAPHQ